MSDGYDLATLKIEVDTTKLGLATTALNDFATASKKVTATQQSESNQQKSISKDLTAYHIRNLQSSMQFERQERAAQLAMRTDFERKGTTFERQERAARLAMEQDFTRRGESILKANLQFEKDWNNARVEDARRTAARLAEIRKAEMEYGISTIAMQKRALTQEGLRKVSASTLFAADAPLIQQPDVYSAAGIKSPQQRIGEINSLKSAMSALHAEYANGSVTGKIYNETMRDMRGRMNLLTEGNSRHRGAIRQTAAAMASLTFEMTGAIYGLTALAVAMAAPGIVGIKLQKSMEDAQAAITGILISMGRIGGKQIDVNQGWKIAGSYIKEVHKDAMRLGIDMDKLVNVNRAIMAPGLAAGLQLEQIKTIATEGAVAVSMIGLNSTQYVQEIRDLVAGGIQPASSTLATALGITDKILKDWKAQGPDVFFNKLHDAIGGFAKAAEELRKSTLSGAWEIMMANFRNLMVDPEAFKGLVGAINQVSDAIASPQFKDIIGQYWTALKGISSALWEIVKVAAILAPILIKIGEAMAVAWVGGKVIAGITAVVSGMGAAITTVYTMTSGVAALTSGMTLYGTAATAAGIATTSMKAAMTSIWVKAGTFGKYGIVGLALWGLYEIVDMTGFIDRIFNNVNVKLEGYKKKISEMSLDAARIEQGAATAEYEKVKASYKKDREAGMGMSWGGAADVDTALKNKRAIDAKVELLERQHQVTVLAAMKDSTEEWNAINMTRTQQLEKEIKKQNDAYLKQSAFLLENGKTDEERQKSQIALAQEYAVKMDVLMGKQKASKAIKIELTEQEKIDIQIQKDIIAEYERKVKQMDSNNDSIAKSNDALRIHNSEIGKTKEEIAMLAVERENHAIKMDEESLAVLDAILVCSAESEALRENIKLRKERRELSGKTAILEAAEQEKRALEKSKKEYEKHWKDIADNMEKTMKGAWDNIFEKGQSVWKSLRDSFKKIFLDYVWTMMAKPITMNIVAGVAGSMGMSGLANAATGGAGGGGISSWMNIGSSLNSAMTMFTEGVSQFMTAGSQIGQAVGYYGSTMAGASGATATAMGTAGSYVGAGLQGIAIGSMIAGDKKLGGMSGTELSTIGAVVGSFIPVIGTMLGGVIGGALGAAFGMGPKQAGTTTLAGQFSQQGFAGQYQTPWSQKGGWFRSNKSGVDVQGVGAEQQAALTNVVAGTKSVFDNLVFVAGDAMKSINGWSFAINRQVVNQEQQNQLIIDMATSMGNYMIPSLVAFKKEGENLADTAVRMKDTFILTDAILNMVGGSFDAVGLASMKMRDNLVNLLGGKLLQQLLQ